MGLLSGVQFISIVGPQKSGKSTVGKALAKQWNTVHVEASDVVRNECGQHIARSDMPKTNERTKTEPTWLGDAIARTVLAQSDSDVVVLTGVREREVFDTLKSFGASLVIIALACPFEERFSRQHEASFDQFIQHDKNEVAIGLKNVLSLAHYHAYSDKTTTLAGVVDSITNLLDNKDAK